MADMRRYRYPVTRAVDVVDDFHGTPVADPYRWLEDQDAPETAAWVAAQHALTRSFLDAVPQRESIRQRLTELWNYPRYSTPYRQGGRYFFSRNDGLQNQAVLYCQETLDSPPHLVLDPNTLSEDGTVALINQAVSEDGRLLAFGTSRSGSDWQELRVRDIDSGHAYDEVIQWCKFTGIAWKHDHSGFFYSRFPEPGSVPEADQSNYNRVYWHQLGTPQSADQLVFERPDAKELAFSPFITDDGQYLVLHVWRGTDPQNRVYYRPVESDGPFVRLLDAADARYSFIDNTGTTFYFQTNLDAPRGRVIAIDINNPGREHWREIIPEGEDVLSFVTTVNQRLVVATMRDVHHEVGLYSLEGAFERAIRLPTVGTISGLSGKRTDDELLISFESFLYPPTTFRYDFDQGELVLFRRTEARFDPEAYATQQVFYASKDGTRVPMFLMYKKGLVRNGTAPTLLYGYGGFNVSLLPMFAASRVAWLDQGGVYAVANLRGGNEYGETWHEAGMLDRKQQVFDDFIAAAEWLIANDYTSSERLAIMGGSNGGLLVAACMIQRPDLYGAVVCAMPVIDMLRYHRFTVGRFWVGEYGNAEENAEHFRFLYAYSPLHNITPGTVYPPTLITTADTDDRVVPAHARKFAAALQAADAGVNPILLRVEQKAGHGLGKPIAKLIDETSDVYAFLMQTIGRP